MALGARGGCASERTPGRSSVRQWDLRLGHDSSRPPMTLAVTRPLAVRVTQAILSSLSLAPRCGQGPCLFAAVATEMAVLCDCPLDSISAWHSGNVLPRSQLDMGPLPSVLGEAANRLALKCREAACAGRICSC